MANSLQKLITKKSSKGTTPPKNSGGQTFGGQSHKQLMQKIKDGNAGVDVLSRPRLPQEIMDKLTTNNGYSVSITESTKSEDLEQELAVLYADGRIDVVIDALRKYLNNNKGDVLQRFWYMLLDCYQITDQKADFDKVALSFAHKFHTSPPSWLKKEEKKGGIVGKNVLILEQALNLEHVSIFKDFLKSAKEEGFCRINISGCKFEKSDVLAVQLLHRLFLDLRKNKVLSVLMGENNLTTFCKQYMNPNSFNKNLVAEFMENEQICWLLYLEVLQWRGKQEEFEANAIEYAVKFEISPPGWDNGGVMKITEKKDEKEVDGAADITGVLTPNNIGAFIDVIKKEIKVRNHVEIDLATVTRIENSAFSIMSGFLQEVVSNFKGKKITFKYPNELLLVLLEVSGITEIIEVTHRKR